MTGKGAGLSNEGLQKKIAVIDSAIALHKPDPTDPVDVLSKVGGFDIAAMVGFYLGCARYRVPAIMDGYISIVAALVAVRLCPAARDALIPSHLSAEPGAGYVMEALGLPPLLRLAWLWERAPARCLLCPSSTWPCGCTSICRPSTGSASKPISLCEGAVDPGHRRQRQRQVRFC